MGLGSLSCPRYCWGTLVRDLVFKGNKVGHLWAQPGSQPDTAVGGGGRRRGGGGEILPEQSCSLPTLLHWGLTVHRPKFPAVVSEQEEVMNFYMIQWYPGDCLTTFSGKVFGGWEWKQLLFVAPADFPGVDISAITYFKFPAWSLSMGSWRRQKSALAASRSQLCTSRHCFLLRTMSNVLESSPKLLFVLFFFF